MRSFIKTQIPILISALALVTISNYPSSSQVRQQGFKVTIPHDVFYDAKTGWGEVYSFKPITIEYQPAQQLIIFSRLKVPDSLHITDITKEELAALPQKIGNFQLLGEFEDYNLPPDFLFLYYVDPKTHDVLELGRRIKDAQGGKRYWRALLFMQDSINYLKNIQPYQDIKK